MFTGLIETTGRLQAIEKSQAGYRLTIESDLVKETKIGDSIAVNGICLTVTTQTAATFTVDVMGQTLGTTNVKAYKKDQVVNLERAMLATSRLDGHMVSGHVDGTGRVTAIRKDGFAIKIWIRPSTIPTMRYILPKGSVAIDGISLTVADVRGTEFMVSIIPHTQQETTLQHIKVGSKVHIETDMIAKYVERMLTWHKEV